jgi:hypothetical protein
MTDEEIHAGGCQCGAIRFRMTGKPANSSICHCRMCQKAFGNLFAPLVTPQKGKFEWTRGRPKHFRSSNHVLRGFCSNCGTPLTYEAPDGIGLALGAFDDPSRLPPTVQYGIEARVDWFDRLPELPGHVTEDDGEAYPYVLDIVSCQHPDHDTETWTTKEGQS